MTSDRPATRPSRATAPYRRHIPPHEVDNIQVVARHIPDGYLNWHRRDDTSITPFGRRRRPDEQEIDDLIRQRVAALRPNAPPA